MTNQKIRIRLKAFDYRVLDQSVEEIVRSLPSILKRKSSRIGRTGFDTIAPETTCNFLSRSAEETVKIIRCSLSVCQCS